jgi:hypothetical protein
MFVYDLKLWVTKNSLELATVVWRANSDALVRLTFNELLENLASEIFNDLKPIPLRLAKPLENYKLSM